MDEIGLFPLGIVLLPTEQVPLQIFEPVLERIPLVPVRERLRDQIAHKIG